MSDVLRDGNGKFAPGTAPGPGRPKRAIEADYARVLADACSLDDWKAICGKAVALAKEGDSRAREWLANRLLGDRTVSLMGLAIRDVARLSTEEEVSAGAELQAKNATGWGAAVSTPFDQAVANRVKQAEEKRKHEAEQQAELDREAERAKRRQRKAQRDAERGGAAGADGSGSGRQQ